MRFGSFFKNRQKNDEQKQEHPAELKKSLDQNLAVLKQLMEEPNDLVIRAFSLGQTNYRCAIVYIDGLVDKQQINSNVLKNLQLFAEKTDLPNGADSVLHEMEKELISVGDVIKADNLDEAINDLLYGSTLVYLDGIDKVLMIGMKGWETRTIMEPVSESLIRGPREGFTENLRTNTMMIRRQIRDPDLRFKTYDIGRRSRKKLVVAYLEGVAHPDLIKEVNRRVESIDLDDAPESGFVEQWIEDSFLSPFPQLMNTERPDKVSAAILQGKIGIILDGTPFALIAPLTIGNSMQSPEDYYERWMIGSFLRGLRYLAAFIAMFLPALYIALLSFHQGMIPSQLAFSIAATREGVPFPAAVEAVIMALTMELLREAGARLPTTIGNTIGIVGGLVIGEAAVQAGIVSPIMVIVVAVTAIASFSIPSYSVAISFRLLRFGFMLAAALLGLYGIILVYIMINIHIVNLKSIGVPYSTPFSPSFFRDWKDLVLRAPITMRTRRPSYLKSDDNKSVNKGET
ncbi:spore germination protein [Lentibacillus halodurans]|uniref:Spore germination protein n=1 Tax=Lentibacillus halodurans TaxID=237679 RepID=A0A1I0YLT5_9BACI|nr:spore germination protein [Lentibacillus halodurans]SFB14294.1 spore germination protein [Lentibacillus halodurans]